MSKNSTQRRLEISRGIKTGRNGVDRNYEDENCRGVIRGFAVMTKGFVKDIRGWEINDQTLFSVIESGKRHALGLKSRFGHPNMSSQALGTFVGRAKDFYLDGDVARADLYISKTAYDTPNGNLASYILDLAERDPDAFGTSVVLGDFMLEEKKDVNGKVLVDEQGEKLPPVLFVTSLLAVDVVDDPAANNSMFGKFFSSDMELSEKASQAFDQILSKPDAVERIIAFLERYRVNRDHIDGENNKKGNQTTQQEGLSMELKDITLEMLAKERPDLIDSVKSTASTEAVSGERARTLDIVKSVSKEFSGMGMESIVEEAIENGHSLDTCLSNVRAKRLRDLESSGNKAPGASDDAEAPKSHLEKARAYQQEHKCSLTEALSKTAPARGKK